MSPQDVKRAWFPTIFKKNPFHLFADICGSYVQMAWIVKQANAWQENETYIWLNNMRDNLIEEKRKQQDLADMAALSSCKM